MKLKPFHGINPLNREPRPSAIESLMRSTTCHRLSIRLGLSMGNESSSHLPLRLKLFEDLALLVIHLVSSIDSAVRHHVVYSVSILRWNSRWQERNSNTIKYYCSQLFIFAFNGVVIPPYSTAVNNVLQDVAAWTHSWQWFRYGGYPDSKSSVLCPSLSCINRTVKKWPIYLPMANCIKQSTNANIAINKGSWQLPSMDNVLKAQTMSTNIPKDRIWLFITLITHW